MLDFFVSAALIIRVIVNIVSAVTKIEPSYDDFFPDHTFILLLCLISIECLPENHSSKAPDFIVLLIG